MNSTDNGKNKLIITLGILLFVLIFIVVYLIFFALDFKKIDTAQLNSSSTESTLSSVSSSTKSDDVPADAQQDENSTPSAPAPAGYLKTCAFTGDFIPVALGIYTQIPSENIFADVNINLGTIATRKINVNGREKTTIQAIKDKKPKNIYVCAGSNDVSWKSKEDIVSEYSDYISKLKSAASGANIYIMALTPVTSGKDNSDSNYNNKKIDAFNSWIKEAAKSKNVFYLDINSILKNDSGHLEAALAESDGYHIKAAGYKKIIDYILSHTAG